MRTFLIIIFIILTSGHLIGQTPAEKLVEQAMERYEVDDYAATLELSEQAVKSDKSYFKAYAYRGFAKFKLKNYKEALADFDRALELTKSKKNASPT